MTQLRLHRDLSYCKVEGRLIFLDIQNDRYFHLTQCLDSALVTYLGGGDAPDSSIQKLIEQKVLISESVDPDDARPSLIKIPTRSAMEEETDVRSASISELLDTLTIVCLTQLQLKTQNLKRVHQKLASLREKRTSRPSMSRPSESHVLEMAAAFRSARLYVPIDMCCLLDSIAMIKFLAKRGLRADLVFGVTGDPFSAHCWAQHSTMILNDAFGHALTFTPIRVI